MRSSASSMRLRTAPMCKSKESPSWSRMTFGLDTSGSPAVSVVNTSCGSVAVVGSILPPRKRRARSRRAPPHTPGRWHDYRSLSRTVFANVATVLPAWQDMAMSQTEQDRPAVLRAARERTRAEITRQILDAARRHLATDGAPGLSLRAIARELGASSSAVYRYVASRDELLTRLIVAAYDALGAAAETAEAAVARADLAGRWSALCGAVRG